MISNVYSIPLWITAILIGSLAVTLYLGSNKASSRSFSLAFFLAAAWTAALAVFLSTRDLYTADILTKFIFFIGPAITAALLYSSISFPEDRAPSKRIQAVLLVGFLVITALIAFTRQIAGQPFALPSLTSSGMWGWHIGPFIPLYIIFTYGAYCLSLYTLYQKYRAAKTLTLKGNIKHMIIGFGVVIFTTGIFNNALPQLGYYDLAWVGGLSGLIWVGFLTYAIVKYHEMDVRIVVTEVLVLAMTIISFANIFLNEFLGIFGRIGTFVAFVILGIYLIRGTLKEAEQRDELSDLNLHLKEKVDEQTKEIRASYEVEKKARQELQKLDETKNQFIMITQHHLRTPVTSIKWQLESMLNNGYGPLAPDFKNALGEMGEAVDRLSHMINDFLNISAWKAGTEILTRSRTSLRDIVTDVLAELHKDLTAKHITISYSPGQKWPELELDKDKMREVIFIILENALRYNVDGGTISIAGRIDPSKRFEFSVENTGESLTGEDIKKIFTELFYRGEQAKTSNPTGMGIGLSMAKVIIAAHRGTITITPRAGGGARVLITLPS